MATKDLILGKQGKTPPPVPKGQQEVAQANPLGGGAAAHVTAAAGDGAGAAAKSSDNAPTFSEEQIKAMSAGSGAKGGKKTVTTDRGAKGGTENKADAPIPLSVPNTDVLSPTGKFDPHAVTGHKYDPETVVQEALKHSDNGRLSYATMRKVLDTQHEQKQKIDDERAAKQRKRAMLWAAIGDGVSSLANLYYTTKGAPSAYDPRTSLSKQAQERYDYLDELARRDRQQRIAYVERERARQAQEDYQNTMLGIRQQAAEEEANARRLQALQDADRWNRKFAFDNQVYKDNIAEKGKDRESRENIAAANNKTRITVAGMRKSGGGGVGGVGGVGSVGGGIPYATLNGVPYATKANYEKAVVGYAKANGIPLQYVKSSGINGRDKTVVNRTIAGLAADVEAHYNKTHAKPQPPAKPQGKPQGQAKKAEVKPQAQAKPQGKTNGKGTVKETGVNWVIIK